MFPVTIHYVKMVHTGGTKEYRQLLVITEDGRKLLIQRWGKVGSPGQSKEEFSSSLGRKLFAQKIDEKLKRGYERDQDFTETFNTVAGLYNKQLPDFQGTVAGWLTNVESHAANEFISKISETSSSPNMVLKFDPVKEPESEPSSPTATTLNDLYGAF